MALRGVGPESEAESVRFHGRRVTRVGPEVNPKKLPPHPTLFYQWQKAFFENGAAAFESRRPRSQSLSKEEDKIAALEAKLRNKTEVLAEVVFPLAARAMCSLSEETSRHFCSKGNPGRSNDCSALISKIWKSRPAGRSGYGEKNVGWSSMCGGTTSEMRSQGLSNFVDSVAW